MDAAPSRPFLASAWPDLLAFTGGLAMAWFFDWRTRDLVWSLWLSSLIVGYAIIVWTIFSPVLGKVREAHGNGAPLAAQAGLAGIFLVGASLLLAFFTVHFGMFHFVHSIFLNSFFPVLPDRAGFPGGEMYFAVVRDYWPFVIVALVAEREAFRATPREPEISRTSVKAEDVNRRLAAAQSGGDIFAAYKNVVRLHLLIFFFAFASFAKLENFFIYAVVYAVYFFPWRRWRQRKSLAIATA